MEIHAELCAAFDLDFTVHGETANQKTIATETRKGGCANVIVMLRPGSDYKLCPDGQNTTWSARDCPGQRSRLDAVRRAEQLRRMKASGAAQGNPRDREAGQPITTAGNARGVIGLQLKVPYCPCPSEYPGAPSKVIKCSVLMNSTPCWFSFASSSTTSARLNCLPALAM